MQVYVCSPQIFDIFGVFLSFLVIFLTNLASSIIWTLLGEKTRVKPPFNRKISKIAEKQWNSTEEKYGQEEAPDLHLNKVFGT